MSTAHETATALPDPAELRTRVRALSVLNAAMGDDPRFRRYTFDGTKGPAGVETASMKNGAGDDFSVHFTPPGVLIRGFDHESQMSPYATDDEQVRPCLPDDVPASLRPLLAEPAFHDEDIPLPPRYAPASDRVVRSTALWRCFARTPGLTPRTTC
ncbi:hypothetical protein [Streptomyces sp. SID8374]|uniref:hypothetical protein n=1 Tax=Streptomyces sp. SID8374 TaxID=2690354 RepID=UPI0019258305|nr:hypothetical protein [Streptomyces sp. SID8374]